ncbi:spermidine/putrescine ABC transporter permease, partial [Paenibacillus riograndensis]
GPGAPSSGASPFTALRKITCPLTWSGLTTCGILGCVGSVTAYTTPALLGGKERVVSTFLYQNAMTLNDWQAASVIAVIMIVITFVVVGLMNAWANRLNPKG